MAKRNHPRPEDFEHTPLLAMWAHVLGSFLIVGFVQEFLVYTAVRSTVYNSQEFDEATDGIVYATAAGIGYATLQNIVFVTASGGGWRWARVPFTLC